MGNYIALKSLPDTATSRLSLPALARSALAAGMFSVFAASAQADISFESKGESATRGERFSMDVRNEPIAKVIDELAERYDFAVDGYPEHWSKDPMSFSATGDLERVLRSLLKDTSHVFEYHTDLQTKETRIASLKLLNEGEEGFVASSQLPKTTLTRNGGTLTRGSGNRNPGRLADRTPTDTQGAYSDGSANPDGSARASAPAPAVQVSGLSRSLEQRARQSAGPSSSVPDSATATPAPADPSMPSADMQALTQKALQDVKGLAEALRKAENGVN